MASPYRLQLTEIMAQLDNVQDAIDILTVEKNAAIKSVTPPDVQEARDAVEIEFRPQMAEAMRKFNDLKGQIQDLCKLVEDGAESSRFKVTYTEPKTQVTRANAVKLATFLSNHPEILKQYPTIGMYIDASKAVARVIQKK